MALNRFGCARMQRRYSTIEIIGVWFLSVMVQGRRAERAWEFFIGCGGKETRDLRSENTWKYEAPRGGRRTLLDGVSRNRFQYRYAFLWFKFLKQREFYYTECVEAGLHIEQPCTKKYSLNWCFEGYSNDKTSSSYSDLIGSTVLGTKEYHRQHTYGHLTIHWPNFERPNLVRPSLEKDLTFHDWT